MIIQSHEIQLNSSRMFSESYEKQEHLEIWDTNNRLTFDNREEQGTAQISRDIAVNDSRNRAFQVELSSEAMKQFERSKIKQTKIDAVGDDDELPTTLTMAQMLLEKFFGIKVEIVKPGEVEAKEASHASAPSSAGQPAEQVANQPQSQGWGIRYWRHEVRQEKETVNFQAGGTVTTEDGREINFDMQLQMSRETYEESHVSFRAGDGFIDPLALNLDGQGVQLTDEKYAFDLDADGETENISFLQQGSGFLVLDKNENGIVDDGGELFGPATGNGFLELRAYDDDQNNWIDERDAIFYDLKVWTKTGEGTDQLKSLEDYDIGALYLDSVGTEMNLDAGQLKESGLYLKENGEVNAIQEIDLKVE